MADTLPPTPVHLLYVAALLAVLAPAAAAQTAPDSTESRPVPRPIARPVAVSPARGPVPRSSVQGSGAPARIGPRRTSGPRIGVTYLSPGVVRRINAAEGDGQSPGDDRIDPSFPVVTQFGWQFEFQTFQTTSGATGVAEIVPLLAGLEHGIISPSLTFITGLRTSRGIEVGVGPNIALSARDVVEATVGSQSPSVADVRVGLALVAGGAARYEGVTLPVNVAVVFGSGGARVSLLLGLNVSDQRY